MPGKPGKKDSAQRASTKRICEADKHCGYAIAWIMNIKSQAKINDESILKSTITFGATLFAKRFLDKAGEKLDKFFKH
jgi:hypothetical protein